MPEAKEDDKNIELASARLASDVSGVCVFHLHVLFSGCSTE